MKTFADWTQELAETVGEVKHHWETRKEADLKAIELEPRWQGYDKGPEHGDISATISYGPCDFCNTSNYLYPYQFSAKSAMRAICNKCLTHNSPSVGAKP